MKKLFLFCFVISVAAVANAQMVVDTVSSTVFVMKDSRFDLLTKKKAEINKKAADAFKTHYFLSDSIDMIFEQGNPAGIKQIFQALGIADNTVRLPLVTVDDSLAQRLNEFVKNSIK